MAGDNFQDNIKLDSATRLVAEGPAIVIGTDPGAKSVVLKNDVGEMHVVGNPSTDRTISLPDSSGTLILSGQAIQGLGVSTGGNTAGNTGTTIGTVVFAGAGIITLSQSTAAGSLATITISATAAAASAVSAIGVSTGGNTAGTTGTTQGTYVLAGGNQITLSQSTAAGSVATVTISGRDAVFGAGVSNVGNTAGSTGTTFGTIVFAGGNNITLSQSTAAGSLATITVSAANSATVVSGIGVSTGGNTLGSTGTTLGTVVLAAIGNVTLSQSTAAGSLATISVSVQNQRMTAFTFPTDFQETNFTISNATLSLLKMFVPLDITATRVQVLMDLTGNSNSTGALTMSLGIYTLSGSTASLATSGSRNLTWTSGSATTVSTIYGGVSGTRYRTLGINLTITPGDYLVAWHFRTTNNGTWRIFGAQAASIVGAVDPNETNYFLNGTSVSSFTTAMPASINVTDTNYARTGVAALRQPGMIMIGTF